MRRARAANVRSANRPSRERKFAGTFRCRRSSTPESTRHLTMAAREAGSDDETQAPHDLHRPRHPGGPGGPRDPAPAPPAGPAPGPQGRTADCPVCRGRPRLCPRPAVGEAARPARAAPRGRGACGPGAGGPARRRRVGPRGAVDPRPRRLRQHARPRPGRTDRLRPVADPPRPHPPGPCRRGGGYACPDRRPGGRGIAGRGPPDAGRRGRNAAEAAPAHVILATDATPAALADLAPGAFADAPVEVSVLLAGGGPNAWLGPPEVTVSPAEQGRGHVLAVAVEARAAEAGGQVTVRLDLADPALRSTSRSFPGRGRARFRQPVPGPGPWQGRVRLTVDDALPADNVRYFTAAAAQAVHVLVVDAAEEPDARVRSADLVEAAFAGETDAPKHVTRRPAGEVRRANLASADLVFWVRRRPPRRSPRRSVSRSARPRPSSTAPPSTPPATRATCWRHSRAARAATWRRRSSADGWAGPSRWRERAVRRPIH